MGQLFLIDIDEYSVGKNMKGDVFVAFNQMVEEQMGIDCWEALLDEVQPKSGGIYTSVARYDDAELLSLISTLSEMKSIPQSVLIEGFGFYLFDELNKKHGVFTQQQPDFFGFIASIDDVIHREVKKLYPETQLPEIKCLASDDKVMQLSYQSPRKLCLLAEGLIRGSAKYYDVDYTLEHQQCMQDGHENCLFTLSLDAN
ncbi:MAG: heme NO-binding domain-containing protein [Cellvibrionaceae bacterium]